MPNRTKHIHFLATLSAALVALAAPGSAAAWWNPGPQPTSTNECIENLGGIQVCEDRNFLGLPNDLGACCAGIRELARDRCECNPAIDVLLGEEGQAIYDIEPVCRIIQPFSSWWTIPPRSVRSCSREERHDYGCEMNDMEVDAARLSSILSFGTFFADAGDENICLDTPQFIENLSTAFEPDAEFYVPYGVGTYTGYEDISEYLGLAFNGLNHGYWQYDLTVDPTKPARLDVSPDGSTWNQGSTFSGTFVRGAYPYTDNYQEQQVVFEGCETRISEYSIVPTPGLRDWVEFFVQTAEHSRRWGVEDICRYHTEFCAGDPETEQYASEAECLEYIGSLPLYSEACGPNRPLSGHSLSCVFKHHMMIAANPPLHCAHIGRLGTADPNHAFKCNDDYECADPAEGLDWPPVENIGPNTPQEVLDLFEANNVGAENEPLGCAIPTDNGGGHGGH